MEVYQMYRGTPGVHYEIFAALKDQTVGRPAERLSAAARADLYVFLAGTGLRVGEVEQLTVADVRLDAVPPHFRVPAAVAKSRKEQTVALRSDLVTLLRRRLAGR
jgi:integrase